MRVFQGLAGLLIVLCGALGGLPNVALADERMDMAQDCFENNGGPQACPTVLGWCSYQWNYDRRQSCSVALYQSWDRVLNAEWSKLKSTTATRRLTDGADGVTPLWDRILAEQRVWIKWRDARCEWQMPAPEGDIRSPGEARFQCLTQMTRARSQQLWDMTYYLQTAGLP